MKRTKAEIGISVYEGHSKQGIDDEEIIIHRLAGGDSHRLLLSANSKEGDWSSSLWGSH
jgi:hypothetical protein